MFSEIFIEIVGKIINRTDKKFYLWLMIRFLIVSMILPYLDQVITQVIINDQYQIGISLFVLAAVIECSSSLYNIYLIEPAFVEVNAIVHQVVEIYTLERLESFTLVAKKIIDWRLS